MTKVRGGILIGVFLAVVAAAAAILIRDSFHTIMVSIDIEAGNAAPPIRIAVIADTHSTNSPGSYELLDEVVDQVIAQTPDVILHVGDYTKLRRTHPSFSTHQETIARILNRLQSAAPVFVVLGNHETWTGVETWRESLSAEGLTVLENEVVLTEIGGQRFCIRGLGDAGTHRYQPTPFPEACDTRQVLTITHDPAAAFVESDLRGLIVAGHTHCGQIRLPLLGAPWTPTRAPSKAHCGLYRDEDRLLYVSSGVGTTVLPIRFGARSSWDLITLR